MSFTSWQHERYTLNEKISFASKQINASCKELTNMSVELNNRHVWNNNIFE